MTPVTPATTTPPAAPEPPAARAAPATPRAGLWSAAGPRLAAVGLGAACIAWSATPLGHSGLAQTALAVSIAAATAGALRLALADIPQPEGNLLLPGYQRAWLLFLAVLRTLAWEETAVVGILWLAVQHPVRPWHTAMLGAGLTAYLLVVHIAESGAAATALLRRQWRLLAVGCCLLVLGAGFALFPAAASGAGAAILRVLAIAAVVAAAVLVLPA